MKFAKLFIAAAAFAAASAQTVKFTNTNFAGIVVGTPFNITWLGATSDITLKLKNGPSNAQTFVETIGSGLTGTSYSWTPESTLVNGIYNLEIDHSSDLPNYSVQFTISGGLASSASVSSATSASVTSLTSSLASTTTTLASSATSASSASSGSISSSASKSAGSTTKPSSSSTAASTATTSIPASGNAAQYASPFAFILVSFAAMVVVN